MVGSRTCAFHSHYFWLLLRRYGGHPIHEASRSKPWRLVHERLLSAGDNNMHEKAFKVVEVQLSFLYDFFYTNYCSIYFQELWWVFMKLILRCIVYLMVIPWSFHKFHRAEDTLAVQYHRFDVNAIVTIAVIVVIIGIEIIELVATVTSSWVKVLLICHYVRNQLWTRRFKERMIGIIVCHTDWRTLYPWERKLGQYTLLESYGHVCWFRWLRPMYDLIISFPRDGQKEGKRIKLSDEVKGAVVASIRTNERKLYNGVGSLWRNHAGTCFLEACDLKTQTHGEQILVWHVATSVCEKQRPPSIEMRPKYEVATSLSKYCAYLVAFAPELLPDHQNMTAYIFDKIVSEAKIVFQECDSTMRRVEKLLQVENGDGSLLGKAGNLGRQLLQIQNDETLWNVLADFWAELIVYLAPSDNSMGHAEHLAMGGEFITHIWALLNNAGILKGEAAEEQIIEA